MVQPKTRNRIIDALMALAAERPWDEVTLATIAERADVTLAALRAAYGGRLDILADFTRRIDERVLEAVDPDMRGEGLRERLFDVLFSRFEHLDPHKRAIENLGKAARRDPLLALELNRIVTGSMAWMLTAAGISATGGRGAFRAQGLALVWARVMRVWLEDHDSGRARTMAALDKHLRRAERAVIRLNRLECIVRPRRRAASKSARRSDIEGDIAEGHPS
jgi:AcrR family transcriptional regulator